MSRPRLKPQQGVAVITALLLTTLAITIVASLFWQQQVQVRSIENQRLQLQKQWILRGALDWTSLILREDRRVDTNQNRKIDHLGEPWAVPLAETRLDQYVENPQAASDVPDAALSGSIVDAQSRFNLNNLVKPEDGKIDPAEVAVFARLLSSLQLNPSLAQATAALMERAHRAAAAGQAGSSGISDPSSGVPMKIVHVDDLLAIPGFSPEAVVKLKDFLVVLPGYRAINVNTAPAEVIAARVEGLSVSEAAHYVANRQNAWFTDTASFKIKLGKQDAVSDRAIAVSTDFFLINGNVRLNRAGMQMQALIDRSDQNGQRPRVLWIREQ